MGFLGIATPLPWELAVKFHAYVREHGVLQFLSVYDRLLKQDATQRKLLWGEEIEFLICKVRRALLVGVSVVRWGGRSLPRCARTCRAAPFFGTTARTFRRAISSLWPHLFADCGWMTAEHPPPPPASSYPPPPLTPRSSCMCMCTPV